MARKLSTEESLKRGIAHRLSNILYEKHMTQKELAERIGVSAPTVSAWCNGSKSPRLDKIDMICDVLGLTRDDILGTGPKQEPDTDWKELPGKRERVVNERTVNDSTVITMEDISLAQRIARADDQTKRLILYLLEFDNTEKGR